MSDLGYVPPLFTQARDRLMAALFGATAQPQRRAKVNREADGRWYCWISNHGLLTAGYSYPTWVEAHDHAQRAVREP